jgi:hypothetical protein
MVTVTDQSPSPRAPQGQSVLEAVLERITYANDDTGYTVARVVGAENPVHVMRPGDIR